MSPNFLFITLLSFCAIILRFTDCKHHHRLHKQYIYSCSQTDPDIPEVCTACSSDKYYMKRISVTDPLRPRLLQLANILKNFVSDGVLVYSENVPQKRICLQIKRVTFLSNSSFLKLYEGIFSQNLKSLYSLPKLSFEDFDFQDIDLEMQIINSVDKFTFKRIRTISTKEINFNNLGKFTSLKFQLNNDIGLLRGQLTSVLFQETIGFSIQINKGITTTWSVNLDTKSVVLTTVANWYAAKSVFTSIPFYNNLAGTNPNLFRLNLQTDSSSVLSISSAFIYFIFQTEYTILPSIFNLQTLYIRVNFKNFFSFNSEISLEVKQLCKLGSNYAFNGSLVTSSPGNNSIRIDNIPELSVSQGISDIMNEIGLSQISSLLGVINVRITNINVTLQTGVTTVGRFSAIVSLFNQNNINLDLIAWKLPNSKVICLSLNFPFSIISTVLNQVIPQANLGNIFSTFSSSNAKLTISNSDFSFDSILSFRPDYLQALNQIGSGVTISAIVNFGSNAIGNFLRAYLGEKAVIVLSLQLTQTSITGSATLNQIPLSNRLVLRDCGIFIKASPSSVEFGITASLSVPVDNDNLIFTGKLIFSTLAVTLSFNMANIYRNAFGWDRLAFGNLLLSSSVSYAAVMTALQFGGEIAVGKDCYSPINNAFTGSGYCMKAIGFFGVDALDPTNNFYYFSMASLNLDIIFRALTGSSTEQSINIPPFLANSISFPEGLFIQYARKDITINNIQIFNGFIMNGKINIFGVVGSIKIGFFNSNSSYEADLVVTPFNFMNIVSVSGFEGPNTNATAKLKVAKAPPTFLLNISCKARILLLTASTFIRIDSSGLNFTISGPILASLFEARLEVAASLVNGIIQNFIVRATLQSCPQLSTLLANVNNGLRSELENARKKIQDAQNNVNKANSDIQNAQSKVCSNINEFCKKRGDCSKSHNDCKSQILKCKGFLCLESFWDCAEYTFVCDLWDYFIDPACKTTCDIAQGALDTASRTLQGANSALDTTSSAFGALNRAANSLLSLSGQLFTLNQATFNLTLITSTVNLLIKVNISGTLAQRGFEASIDFDFGNLDATTKRLVDLLLERLKSIFIN